MGAQLWTAGPAHFYVGFPPSEVTLAAPRAGGASYLGTADDSPEIWIEGGWRPLFSDRRGKQLPAEMLATGEQAYVRVSLTRWDESVYASLAVRPGFDLLGLNSRGKMSLDDIGSLMLAEGQAHNLWVQFPYQQFPGFNGLPAGYRFPGSWLEEPDKRRPGLGENTLELGWHCIQVEDGEDLVLYDDDMTGLPNPT